MIEISETSDFSDWLAALRDAQARTRIQARILRLRAGNVGDAKPVGEGVSELRIDYGPGYRVYFVQHAKVLIILLADGTKRSQSKDIRRALNLARDI